MNAGTRTINSVRNIIVSLSYQLILLFLSFMSRTIFIKTLGAEYLGINGLYSNILSVLSLADLGIGSAIIYCIYKPLAENDIAKISALMNFYKRIYRYIAIAVGVIGIALVPFLDILVKTDTPIQNLELYYVLFLSNTIMSYLFIYKSAIIIADQKLYLIKIYSFAFEIIRFIFQIVILVTTHNYMLYLIVQLLCTFLNNLFIAYKSNKLYPYIKNAARRLNKAERGNIIENIKSMFLYRIGGVILNSTDNIFISSMIGTVWVGIYSNYFLIVGAVQGFTEIVYSSISASVGNLNVSEDMKIKEKLFRVIDFSTFWLYGFCSICFFVLLDDFITLWLGKEFCLGLPIVVAILLNFYIPGMLRSTALFRDTTGLFKQTKYVFLITAVINLGLSFFLGLHFGLAGILYATAISRMLTNVWFEPMMLYKKYFQKSSQKYFSKQVLYFALLCIICGLISFIASFFNDGSVAAFIKKMILCLLIPNVIFAILFYRTDECKYLIEKYYVMSHSRRGQHMLK
ncbi:MAG: hypothetical protein ABFC84_17860 [Veillonellales bacterium]